jgi:hypothetical protein
MIDITRTFTGSRDFEAFNAAVAWLKSRRFSVGPMQHNDPVAILYGENICIGKWRTISKEFQEAADGTIEAADMRTGPVTVTIRARASDVARRAFADTKAVAA